MTLAVAYIVGVSTKIRGLLGAPEAGGGGGSGSRPGCPKALLKALLAVLLAVLPVEGPAFILVCLWLAELVHQVVERQIQD
eukprot:3659458-Ditylum_brightwellii.AAC.1